MVVSLVVELFDVVPPALRLAAGLDLAPGMSEPDVLAAVGALAGRNRAVGSDLVCFAGGGAYDHEVPAAVHDLSAGTSVQPSAIAAVNSPLVTLLHEQI